MGLLLVLGLQQEHVLVVVGVRVVLTLHLQRLTLHPHHLHMHLLLKRVVLMLYTENIRLAFSITHT
jgi:hypothetical protein